MEQLKQKLEELSRRFERIRSFLDIPQMKAEIAKLEKVTLQEDFWNNQENARQKMTELDGLRQDIESVEKIEKRLNDVLSVSDEAGLLQEIKEAVVSLEKDIASLEIRTFLSGKYDKGEAILSIHAGQGGIEAMDWANMLLRMYLRYIEKQNWSYKLAEQTPGEEAGIKSATLIVIGRWAYGYLKGEAGTHRLVRQSPFNADRLRQTSFALVEVMPKLTDKSEINIDGKDLTWQFFRASSQGGQNVQKVSTAVRLTHKPTGIVVTAQQERSQEQNRRVALDLLRAKLWARKEAERAEQARKLKGSYHPASWGTQIRSYVLHPYKMVRDLRTGVESHNPESVLDGNLDEFIEAELKLKNRS